MTAKYYYDIEQGTDEWHDLRCGLLTASEFKLILTPTLKIANNDKTKGHVYDIAAQRISGYTEPFFETYDMARGSMEEHYAREYYDEFYGATKACGFVTNHGLGFSPDGLVNDDGFIEIKSRRQKFQIETIIKDEVPKDYMMQIQSGLYITGREWCDFIQYSNGLPLFVMRVYVLDDYQDAIIESARIFEEKVAEVISIYEKNSKKLIKTERQETHIGEQITVTEGK